MRYSLLVILFLSSTIISAQDISQFQTFWGYRYYVDAQPINKLEVEQMLSVYPDALNDWQRGKQSYSIGLALLGAEIGCAYWTISNLANNKSTTLPLLGMLSTGVSAIVFSYRSRKLKRNALLSHNQLNNKSGLSFSTSGLGLQLKF